MIPSEIIIQKRERKTISKSDLKSFIHGYIKGDIPDYQMSALLMSIFFNGMNDEEIFTLTEIMLHSGQKMDFSELGSYVADKHSTGGVGDKVSIVLGPLLASAGVAIPMISGRSLGHTGGTLDKLETIPGFKVDLDLDFFKSTVEKIGISMIGQTQDICPADRKMYALRDVTGTIESIPLICSSIMSKKIAEGIQGLVLDVKVGNGAFMKTIQDGKALGGMLAKIGTAFDVQTDVVYSNMDRPLGNYAGLWCEVQESIHTLEGNGPADILEITFELGSRILKQAGICETYQEAVDVQTELIQSGKALEKFMELVEAQGGNPADIRNNEQVHNPMYTESVNAPRQGYITKMDTYRIGMAAIELGCGRKRTDDSVDPTAGMEFIAKTGDFVEKDQPILRCFNSNQSKLDSTLKMVRDTFRIEPNHPGDFNLIL